MFYSFLFGKGFGLTLRDTAMGLHIWLIAGNDYDEIFIIGMLPELADPFLDLLKGLGGNDFIDDDGPNSIPIVDRRNCIVLFLAGGVPDGKFD